VTDAYVLSMRGGQVGGEWHRSRDWGARLNHFGLLTGGLGPVINIPSNF
jgi:hypothetical protein